MKTNRLIKSIIAVISSVALVTVTIPPILHKPQVYQAASSRILLDYEDFTVNWLLGPTSGYSGAVYFNPSAGHLLYTDIPEAKRSNYGLKLVDADDDIYVVAPKLTSSVTKNKKFEESQYNLYAVTDKTNSNNLIRKETYLDPALAVEGQPLSTIYIHRLVFKDGSVAEFNDASYSAGTDLSKGILAVRRPISWKMTDGSFYSISRFTSEVLLASDGSSINSNTISAKMSVPDKSTITGLNIYGLYFSPKQYSYDKYATCLPEFQVRLMDSVSPKQDLITYFNFKTRSLESLGSTSSTNFYSFYDGSRMAYYQLPDEVYVCPKSSSEFEIQADIDALTEQIAQLTTKIASIKSDTSKLTVQLNNAVAELNNIKGTLQTSGVDTSSLTAIQTSITNFKNQINTLTQQKSVLEAEKATLNSRITALTVQVSELQSENQELNDKITQLTANLGIAENSLNSLNIVIVDLNSQISNLENDLLDIKAALGLDPDATQAQIIAKITSIKSELETYKTVIEAIGTTLGSPNPSDIVAVKQQAEQTKEDLTDIRAKIDALKDMIEGLGFEPAEDLTDELNKLISSYNEQITQLATYTDFINTLISQLGIDTGASLDDILTEIANLQDQLQQHKDAVTEINASLNIDSASSLQDTKDTVAQRSEELNTLNGSFKDIKNKLSLYLAVNNSLPTERERAEQAVKDFTAMYDEVNAEANRLLTFLQDCQTILSLDSSATTVDILNRIRALQQQLTLANQKIEGYDENVNQMADILNLDKDSLSSDKISVVNYQTSMMKKDLNNTKNDLSTLQSELASITGVAGTSKAVQDLVNQLNANIADSLSKVNELTSINSSISKALGLGSGANLDEVLDKIGNIHDEMDNLNKSNTDLTKNNNILTGQNEIYGQDNSYLKGLTNNQLKELLELLKKVDATTMDPTVYNNIITRIQEMEDLLNSGITDSKTAIAEQISSAKSDISNTVTNSKEEITTKINSVGDNISEAISNSTTTINNSLNGIDKKIDNGNDSVLAQLDGLTQNINNISTDQGNIEGRLDGIESQLNDLKSLILEVTGKQDIAANSLAELESRTAMTNQSTDTILEKIVPYNLGSTLQENNSILTELVTRDVTIPDTPIYIPSPAPVSTTAPTEAPTTAPTEAPTLPPSTNPIGESKPTIESTSYPTEEPVSIPNEVKAEEDGSTFLTWLNANKLLIAITAVTLLILISSCIYFIKKRNEE